MRFSRLFHALLACTLFLGGLVVVAGPASAHRDGCHRWHSCPSDSGSYTCGDLGYNDECPGRGAGLADIPDVDYSAPRRPTVSGAGSRPRGMVAVTVKAERGATVEVESEGRTIHEVTATGGPQLITFKGLAGSHQYDVSATDSSDNASAVATFNATADAVAPSLTGVAMRAGTATDSHTSLTFAPGENAGWVLRVDGRKIAGGTVGAEGRQVVFPVRNGRHKVSLTLTDAAGNISTLRKQLTVAIGELTPALEVVSEPNVSTQEFSLTGSPGSKGLLKIAGRTVPVAFGSATTTVDVNLPDGQYDGARFTVRDEVGRTGSLAVPSFAVDTVKPSVRVDRRGGGSAAGRFVALVAAETGAHVVWRMLDKAGHEVRRGAYVAGDEAHRVDVDVEEGKAVLEVEASDDAGNVTSRDAAAIIGTDPLTGADWVIASVLLLLMLVILGLLCLALLIGWRKRDQIRDRVQARRHRRAVLAAQRAYDAALERHASDLARYRAAVDQHQRDLEIWTTRDEELGELLTDVRAGTAFTKIPWSFLRFAKARKGERLLAVVGGSLIDQRSRQNVPTLVEVADGNVAITDQRVLFSGVVKKREWAFDKLQGVSDIEGDVTLLRVSNRKTLSGIRYQDADRTRVLLALATGGEQRGGPRAASMAEELLRNHATKRPAGPGAPPPPPVAPAILLEGQLPSTAPAAWAV